MIGVAIFDLDGVVVDTAKYHFLAWRRLADELGFVFTESDNEMLKGVSRMRSLEILLSLANMQNSFTQSEKEAMAERKNVWYLEFISQMKADEVLPGVATFIAELRTKRLKIALGSASKNAGLILERLGITNLFDAIVDGTMVATAKPDPEVFLKCATLLNAKPSSCLVFEDATAGLEAARRCGMSVIGVGSAEILGSADLVISSFVNLNWCSIKYELDDK